MNDPWIEKIKHACAYLANVDGHPALGSLARRFGGSPYHFQRTFKSAFGISPMQFLQRRRLEVARDLLLTSDDDVTSICYAVGFQSLGSFSALFKRRLGYSPIEYRSQWSAAALQSQR